MPLWIIGLGLGDERDVTVKGADAIRGADVVFLECYTSILAVPQARLEAAYGKPVRIAYRETVESEAELLLGPAKEGKSVAFLVVGDPLWCVVVVACVSQCECSVPRVSPSASLTIAHAPPIRTHTRPHARRSSPARLPTAPPRTRT